MLDVRLHSGLSAPTGAFAHLARHGFRAPVEPIHNAVTAAINATFETGAVPAIHGIVGNTFRRKGTPFVEVVGGFDIPPEAETLWEAAARQGKRVVTIGSLFVEGTQARPPSTASLPQSVSVGPSRFISLSPGNSDWSFDARRIEHVRPLEPIEGSEPLIVEVTGEPPLPLYSLAVDTVRDGRQNYHALWLDSDRNAGNGLLARLIPEGWASFQVTRRGSYRIGSWVKLMMFTPDLSKVQLHLRAPQQNRGHPASFIEAVEARLGLPPGGPDWSRYRRGQIDEQTLLEEIDRELAYVARATAYVLRQNLFDVLAVDYPRPDRIGHAFLLTDTAATGSGSEGVEEQIRFARHIASAYDGSDHFLHDLLSWVDPDVGLMVVSVHGFAPVHTSLDLHSLLAGTGLRQERGPAAEVMGVPSKVSAHIYLNLEGREPGGIVPSTQYTASVQRIVTPLDAFRDPRTGAPVFDHVLPASELYRVGLDHAETAGDVWVGLKPGYVFHIPTVPGQPLIDRPFFRGEHGYDPTSAGARGVFLCLAPGCERASTTMMHVLDIAVTAAAVLGIDPPKDSQGKNALSPSNRE